MRLRCATTLLPQVLALPAVQGVGFRVWGLGFRVSGLALRDQGLALQGLECNAS